VRDFGGKARDSTVTPLYVPAVSVCVAMHTHHVYTGHLIFLTLARALWISFFPLSD
jgi:hypothetical protein